MTTPNNLTYETPEKHMDGSWHVLVSLPDQAHDFVFQGNNPPLGEQIDITYLNWQTANQIADLQNTLEMRKSEVINALMNTIENNLIGTVL